MKIHPAVKAATSDSDGNFDDVNKKNAVHNTPQHINEQNFTRVNAGEDEHMQ
jgi:hypothetical protein